jgi:AcrR family transcriptional regulator
MSDRKRPYRKRRRAELEAETRRRITESAVELHGTVGPALTSISAVAEGAGVRRSTVYRHFPDEVALFDACSAHWSAANPPPDLERWATIADPDERLAAALPELYAYYRRTETMPANLLRDEDEMPVLKERFAAFRQYLAQARQSLLRGRALRGRARGNVAAAIGHALSFTTWRSLAREQGLDDAGAAALMAHLVSTAEIPG